MKSLFSTNSLLLANGATGSELQRRGMTAGQCPALWAIEHPGQYENLARAYVGAGAAFIATPTFGGNPAELAHFGLQDRCEEINEAAVRLARRAAGTVAVAAEIGPTGQLLCPLGELDFEDAVALYRRQVAGLLRGQPDFFLLETFSDPQEARSAVLAIKELCDLPFVVSFTFQNGRTMTGATPEAVAVMFTALGAAAVGCNCSGGPASLEPVVHSLAAHTPLPIMAKPNAGIPEFIDGQARYPMLPEDFARETAKLARSGATILGGCCGASPAHIAALGAQLTTARPSRPESAGRLFIASARRVAPITVGGPLCLVGERINPSGKATLSAALQAGNTDETLRLAREQWSAGVHALDVNVGVGGIDEKAVLLAVIDDLSLRCEAPLFVDCADADAMEAALRRTCGRAACNSIAIGPNASRLLAACRRYGALPVLMPLDGWNLPESTAGRHALLDKLLVLAADHGYGPQDVLVDCATPCLAMGTSAQPAVDFVAELRARGIATIAGVSNVSFRLPGRDAMNSAYLCQLAAAGLSAALVNPTWTLRTAAAACDALRGADECSIGYIRHMRQP